MQSCQLKINSIIFDKGKTFDTIKINFNENITAIPEAIQGADFTGSFVGCYQPGFFYAGSLLFW